jgi:hypothetical protein
VNFDRDTKDFLVAVEKSNTRMLTDLSRVLEANGKKDDARIQRVVDAQQETASAVRGLICLAILQLFVVAVELWRHW